MVTSGARILRVCSAELGDRAVRFEMHLDAIEAEFYASAPALQENTAPFDKPLLVRSFRDCVQNVLRVAAGLFHVAEKGGSEEIQSAMLVARHAFLCINRLHEEGLVHLPRPSEPIELRRFCRILSRHIRQKEPTGLAVYITESIAEGAFAADPLTELKETRFNGLNDMFNELRIKAPLAKPTRGGEKVIHVTMGRVDARNAVRWPTLFHEAAHKLLTPEITGGISIAEQFLAWAPVETEILIANLKVDAQRWLTESWCDLFAALVMGPSFFFSQFGAFICTPPTDFALSNRYPPHAFRLRLIATVLMHLYPQLMSRAMRGHFHECVAAVEYWDTSYRLSITADVRLQRLFEIVRAFFQEHFFAGQGSEPENFRRKFVSMVKYVEAIDQKNLQRMKAELAEGLPVASKPRQDNALSEEPTSVQEVLLAAWLDRNERLRWETMAALSECEVGDWDKTFEKVALPGVHRFDDAVLRSIQLAEWLHALAPPADATQERFIERRRRSGGPGSLLNDLAIAALLRSGRLRVMPLVSLDNQLGATSLDIRLGTSFEVFLPASRRAASTGVGASTAYDSRRIDLDYLEHIVLLPGQFMLAHSFEYTKFPDNLAAELDGRSSYARLGLEVHMTAGMIDPGFEGVVTFELFNSGPNPIELFPGLRIAQLRFVSVEKPRRPYSKLHRAKYRGLLQHNKSLYMNDPDYKRLVDAIQTFGSTAMGEDPETGSKTS